MTYGVRIFAECEADEPLLPLWPCPIEAAPPSRARLPISGTLRRELEAWNAQWDYLAGPQFDERVDWSEWPEAVAWNVHGYELARRLRAELADNIEIVYFDYVTGEDVLIVERSS